MSQVAESLRKSQTQRRFIQWKKVAILLFWLASIVLLICWSRFFWTGIGLLSLFLVISLVLTTFKKNSSLNTYFLVVWVLLMLWITVEIVLVLWRKDWNGALFLAVSLGLPAFIGGLQAQRRLWLGIMANFSLFLLSFAGSLFNSRHSSTPVFIGLGGIIEIEWFIIVIGLALMNTWDLLEKSIVGELDKSIQRQFNHAHISKRKYERYLATLFQATRNIIWQALTSALAFLAALFAVFRTPLKNHTVVIATIAVLGILLIGGIYKFQIQLAKREAWVTVGRLKEARGVKTNPLSLLGMNIATWFHSLVDQLW